MDIVYSLYHYLRIEVSTVKQTQAYTNEGKKSKENVDSMIQVQLTKGDREVGCTSSF